MLLEVDQSHFFVLGYDTSLGLGMSTHVWIMYGRETYLTFLLQLPGFIFMFINSFVYAPTIEIEISKLYGIKSSLEVRPSAFSQTTHYF